VAAGVLGGETVLVIGLASVVALAVILVAWAIFDQGRAGRASESLRATAETMGALPIASMRDGAQIIFFRQDASSSDTPFAMLLAGESRPMTAAEIRGLWKRGRLWWYHTGETPPLGLTYYLRYVDGQYASSCSCVSKSDPVVDRARAGDAAEVDDDSR
jgi:hypothetical protein